MDTAPKSFGRLDRLARAMHIAAVQADCSVDDAWALMTERARSARCTLEDLATAVIDGRVRFDQ